MVKQYNDAYTLPQDPLPVRVRVYPFLEIDNSQIASCYTLHHRSTIQPFK